MWLCSDQRLSSRAWPPLFADIVSVSLAGRRSLSVRCEISIFTSCFAPLVHAELRAIEALESSSGDASLSLLRCLCKLTTSHSLSTRLQDGTSNNPTPRALLAAEPYIISRITLIPTHQAWDRTIFFGKSLIRFGADDLAVSRTVVSRLF